MTERCISCKKTNNGGIYAVYYGNLVTSEVPNLIVLPTTKQRVQILGKITGKVCDECIRKRAKKSSLGCVGSALPFLALSIIGSILLYNAHNSLLALVLLLLSGVIIYGSAKYVIERLASTEHKELTGEPILWDLVKEGLQEETPNAMMVTNNNATNAIGFSRLENIQTTLIEPTRKARKTNQGEDHACENCRKRKDVKGYTLYYARMTTKNDREARYLPTDKETPFRVVGESVFYICRECLSIFSRQWGLRYIVLSALILAICIISIAYLLINNRSSLGISQDVATGLWCILAFVGIFSATGLFVGILRYTQLDMKWAVNEFAGKVKAVELKSAGASRIFSQAEFATLVQRPAAGGNVFSNVFDAYSMKATKTGDTASNRQVPRETLESIRKMGIEIDLAKVAETEIDTRESGRAPSKEILEYEKKRISASLRTSAGLAIANALFTFLLAFMQFSSGYDDALPPAIINTITGIAYVFMSFNIRSGEIETLTNALRAVRFGLLWVLAMLVYYVNTSGGLDAFAAFIFCGWLISDGLLYVTIKNILPE